MLMRNPSIGNEGTASHEMAPRLKLESAKGAKNVREAIDIAKVKGTLAGQKDLEWVLDKNNAKEARKMLNDEGAAWYLFPDATQVDGKSVKFVTWNGMEFVAYSAFYTNKWSDALRIVFTG